MALVAALALAQAASGELPPPGKPEVPAQPAATCSGKLYEAFDFWLGEWNVFARGGAEPVGRSRVEKINQGCAVRETWLPLHGPAGGNLNAPDLITGLWHQYFTDSTGGRVDLEGGPFRGSLILSGAWRRINGSNQDAVLRVTYTRLDADSVRQLAEFSTDDGLTWQTAHEYLYLRAGTGD